MELWYCGLRICCPLGGVGVINHCSQRKRKIATSLNVGNVGCNFAQTRSIRFMCVVLNIRKTANGFPFWQICDSMLVRGKHTDTVSHPRKFWMCCVFWCVLDECVGGVRGQEVPLSENLFCVHSETEYLTYVNWSWLNLCAVAEDLCFRVCLAGIGGISNGSFDATCEWHFVLVGCFYPITEERPVNWRVDFLDLQSFLYLPPCLRWFVNVGCH